MLRWCSYFIVADLYLFSCWQAHPKKWDGFWWNCHRCRIFINPTAEGILAAKGQNLVFAINVRGNQYSEVQQVSFQHWVLSFLSTDALSDTGEIKLKQRNWMFCIKQTQRTKASTASALSNCLTPHSICRFSRWKDEKACHRNRVPPLPAAVWCPQWRLDSCYKVLARKDVQSKRQSWQQCVS